MQTLEAARQQEQRGQSGTDEQRYDLILHSLTSHILVHKYSWNNMKHVVSNLCEWQLFHTLDRNLILNKQSLYQTFETDFAFQQLEQE